MTKRVHEDHKYFEDVVGGRTRKKLQKLVKSSKFVRLKPKGDRVITRIKGIEQPFFAHGDNGEGIGRGPGEKGKVVGYDPPDGQGEGGEAGDGEEDGILISVDLKEVLKLIGETWKLPNMKPKPAEVFEEVKKRYNAITRTGPESLRHTRRTMLEAMKRLASTNTLDNEHIVPGSEVPIKLITPINSDRRYRQYNELHIPTSNAAIFFARDCSGSVSDMHCDIISDTCWWIDCWIRQFYKKTERSYWVHDSRALEVDSENFYKTRQMGGTKVSSVFEAIADQLENRFPPWKWNIYVFYFTDGDNIHDDNQQVVDIIQKKFPPDVVNLVGFTEVCPYNRTDDMYTYLEKKTNSKLLPNFRLAGIGLDSSTSYGGDTDMSEDDRNQQIMEAIGKLLKEGD